MQRGLGMAKRCYEHDGPAVLMFATVEPSFTLQWFIERKRWLAWLCSAPAGPCCAGRSGNGSLDTIGKEIKDEQDGQLPSTPYFQHAVMGNGASGNGACFSNRGQLWLVIGGELQRMPSCFLDSKA